MKAVLSQEAVVAAVRDSGLDQKTLHTILRQHGADRVSELDPRKYASVLAALTAARMTAAASVAERCLTAGYDIISVIPPDAPLSPSSTITPSQRGKTPGVRRDDGLWTGYGWRANTATVEDARAWHTAGASIGIKTGAVVGLDIDATDVALSAALCDLARATLGPAPCRIGRPPKALLVYRTTEPRPKQKLYIWRGTENHAIEALGIGQQFVAHGIHPGTRQPYAWDGDGLPAVDALPVVSAAQLDAYLEAAARLCEARGYATRRDGAAATHEVSSVSQALLQAPTLDLLRDVVRHIPNTESRFPLRDDFLKVACAIAAAAGDDREAGHGIFQEWAAAYDGAGGNDPEYVENTYRSLKPPFRVGYNWLCELAREHGFNDAARDFGDATGTAPNQAESNDDAPPGARAGLERLNREYAIVGGTIWRTPEGGTPYPMRRQQWLDHLANQAVIVNGKSVKLSTLWMNWSHRRTYNRCVFNPALPPFSAVPSDDGEGDDLNLWPGLATVPALGGSCDRFLDHLRFGVANGDETAYRWVLQWLAAIVQQPERRPGTALVLRGRQGTGKTVVGMVMRRLLGGGLHLLLAQPEAVTGKFNAQHEGKLLLQAEEAFYAGDKKQVGALKHMITSDFVSIERKGVDPVVLPNYARLLVTSNERWIIPAGESERRFTVLDVSNAHAHDSAYHNAMHEQLDAGGYARLMHHLLHEVEVDWDFIGRPLANAALRDQQLESLDAEHQWWLGILTTGFLPDDAGGTGCTPCASLFDSYAGGVRSAYNRPTKAKLGRFMSSVGAARVRPASAGKREREYQLPSLRDARATFASRFAIAPDWPDPESDWAPDPHALGMVA